jgi:hypothetical protein
MPGVASLQVALNDAAASSPAAAPPLGPSAMSSGPLK